jgi:hypothetical protein
VHLSRERIAGVVFIGSERKGVREEQKDFLVKAIAKAKKQAHRK